MTTATADFVQRVECCLRGYHVPYCLVVTPCSLLRPPPIFGRYYCIGLFTSITYTRPPLPPPPPRRPLEPVCQFLPVYACCKCRRVVFVYQASRKYFENWSWPFSLISDGFLRPSSCRRGRWEESGCETTCNVLRHVRGQQLFHPSVLPRHVDRRSSRSSTALQSTLIRGRGGGA